MTDCAKCGHELGVGRYCTNCGAPVDSAPASPDPEWRTDTAERPRTPPPLPPGPPPASPPPASPPPAWTPPPAPRFPLYADEVVDPVDEPVGEADDEVPQQTDHRRSRSTGAWVAAAVVLVLVLLVGVWLVTAGDDDAPPTTGQPDSSGPAAGGDPSGEDDRSDVPASPAPSGLTAESQVTVPATAAPGADVDGNPVGFDGTNMLDGVPETCWRMPGDGTGEEIVVTLPEETRLRSVGMINGYAKQGGAVDWYHGNRRVEQVEWVFDDGTTVPQTFDDTEAVQSVDVDVTTRTVTIRLVAVSEPGKGPSRRDFTAISDLLFVAR
jgi:hypothetical protein